MEMRNRNYTYPFENPFLTSHMKRAYAMVDRNKKIRGKTGFTAQYFGQVNILSIHSHKVKL